MVEHLTRVFRLTPEIGKCYETVIYTRREGKWPNEKYYTTLPLTYVGEFMYHSSTGYRDNASHQDTFNHNGEKVVVRYTYEGTTCFRECEKR